MYTGKSICLLVFRHKKHVTLLTFEKWPLPSLPAGDFQKKVRMQKAFFHMQKFKTAKTEL